MAVSLGATSNKVAWGGTWGLGGLTVLSVAVTVKFTATPVTNQRLFSVWNATQSQSTFILENGTNSAAELLFAVTNGSLTLQKETTGVSSVNGSLVRIVFRFTATGTMSAYVNGVSKSLTNVVTNSIASLPASPSAALEIGADAGANAGAKAEYSDAAVWKESIPDWMAIAYGQGFSPLFYRPNLAFYCPLLTINKLNDLVVGTAGTNTSGTDVGHPAMYYPDAPQVGMHISSATRKLWRPAHLDGISTGGAFFANPAG